MLHACNLGKGKNLVKYFQPFYFITSNDKEYESNLSSLLKCHFVQSNIFNIFVHSGIKHAKLLALLSLCTQLHLQ